MPISQRLDSPYWWAAAKNPSTGRVERWSTGETLQPAAKRALKDRLAVWKGAMVDNPEGLQTGTLAVALDSYVASLGQGRTAQLSRGLAAKMLGKSSATTERLTLDGKLPLMKLKSQDIKRLREARIAEGTGVATILSELRVLRQAVAFAGKSGWQVPAKRVWPTGKGASKRRNLSREDFMALYNYLDPQRTDGMTKVEPMIATRQSSQKVFLRQRQEIRDTFVGLLMVNGRWEELETLTWRQIQELRREWPEPILELLTRRWNSRGVGTQRGFPGAWIGAKAVQSLAKPIRRAMAALEFNEPAEVAAHGRCDIASLRHTLDSWYHPSPPISRTPKASRSLASRSSPESQSAQHRA